MSKKKQLLLTVIASLLIGFLAALWAKYVAQPYYSSTAVIKVVDSKISSSISQLIARSNPFASITGDSLGADYDPASEIRRRILTNSFLKDFNEKYFLFDQLSSFFPDQSFAGIDVVPFLGNYLSDNLYISNDISSGFVDITLLTPDKNFSKDVLVLLIKEYNEVSRQKLLNESEQILDSVQQSLTGQNSVFVEEVLYAISENQLRQLLIAKTTIDAALEVIDPPFVNHIKAKPKAKNIGISFAIWAQILLLLLISRTVIFNFIKNDFMNVFKDKN